jgi:hypothetical protein
MRTAIVLAFALSGCLAQHEQPELLIVPSGIDLEVELGIARTTPVQVFADGVDITAQVTMTVEGLPLGRADANGFTASGSLGGRAMLVATFDGQSIRAPLHVALRGVRFVGDVPREAPGWFRAGAETNVEAEIEPGDGAVLPPNLGRVDIQFAADDWEDVHELAVTAPDVDIRVYALGAPGQRTIALNAAEWYALAESNLGSSVDVAARSMRVIARENVHTARAMFRIADLPFAREVLFTGRGGVDLPKMWSYDAAAARTTAWMPNLAAGSCLGCHVAASKDGRRIAAGGNDGVVGGGVVLDAWSRTFTAPYNNANTWTSATYDATGALLTTTQGILTWRDGLTATALGVLPTDVPANQPAMSNTTGMLAYVGGPLDATTQNPTPQQIQVQSWSPATGTLVPGKTLVAPVAGDAYKLPEWSPDDAWLLYTRVRGGKSTIVMMPTDGRFIPTELVHDADYARFASPLATVRAGSIAAEPVAWIVMRRAHGLWAAAFFPERGVVSRPFLLPGQRADIAVLHAPLALP